MLVCQPPFFQSPSDVPDTEKQNTLIHLQQIALWYWMIHLNGWLCFDITDPQNKLRDPH